MKRRTITHIKISFAFAGAIFCSLSAVAQCCESKAFSLTYTASDIHTVNKSVTNEDNTVITVGGIGVNNATRAWISKRSAQGNIIWSFAYNPYCGSRRKALYQICS